ncbi:MAG: cytochrome P450 [Acidimicrobiia bacterium]|nr:MAG: cytochrome P450 [Acidimicrobiia bacterium]
MAHLDPALLAHIPGDMGWPVIGRTVPFARDALSLVSSMRDRFGPVFKVSLLGQDFVVVSTPHAAKQVFLDREQIFSSEVGWESSIGSLFSRGLMLRDFDDHRIHRRIMRQAFRRDALVSYLDLMHPVIEEHLDRWRGRGEFDVYPGIKELLLDIAVRVFVGAPLGPEADAVNRAFIDSVMAGVSPIRSPLPGTQMRRGLAGRRYLVDYFGGRVAAKRAAPESADMFSRLCHAEDEEGNRLTDDEVVDHMIFLLLAAHDTTTGTLSAMLWYLATSDDWQARVREEVRGLPSARVDFDGARSMEATGLVFKEATRLHPPVPFSPRGVLSDTEIDGVAIPQGVAVSMASILTHRDPEWWDSPEVFDPQRFTEGRAEHERHSHNFVPFGGGAHTCLGRHFADLNAKAVIAQVFSRFDLAARPGASVTFQAVPIPKPRNGLPLTLRAA